ncbi:MAG: YCF48-related protein [Pyrinomonadaceae bacterium]
MRHTPISLRLLAKLAATTVSFERHHMNVVAQFVILFCATACLCGCAIVVRAQIGTRSIFMAGLNPPSVENGQGRETCDSPFVRDLNLNAIVAKNESDVWVIGDGEIEGSSQAVIANSLDGGVTWAKRYLLPQSVFYDIKFVTPQLGFVTGVSRNSRRGIVLRTRDGGANWERLPVAIDESWVRMMFRDSENGWIVGADGRVIQTKNGGSKWTRTSKIRGKGLNSISAPDNQNVWITGKDAQVYQSEDNGKTWRNAGSEMVALLDRWKFSKINFSKVEFVGPYHGYIAAEGLIPRRDAENEKVFDFTGIILVTDDAGASWTPRVVNTSIGLAHIQFENLNEIWIIPSWGWSENKLLHSVDGARTWNVVSHAEEMDRPYAIYFIDSTRGWVLVSWVIHYSQIFGTRDGGKTWERYTKL